VARGGPCELTPLPYAPVRSKTGCKVARLRRPNGYINSVSNYTTHSNMHYAIRNSCTPPKKYKRGHPAGQLKLLQLETPLL